MCALVQAVRKLGISSGGPGLGAAVNPMHIVRDNPVKTSSRPPSRPGTSSSQSSDFDPSFGQQKRVIDNPLAQLGDDDSNTHWDLEDYQDSKKSEKQLSDTTDVNDNGGESTTKVQVVDLSSNQDIRRGKSFGRRRKPVQRDLEAGVFQPRVQFEPTD
jgi:hypothetical protein